MSLGGFLSNESLFGRIMTKVGTIIVLNILFAVTCIPFFTVGAAAAAMYYTVFAMLRAEEADRIRHNGAEINPIKVYWEGLRKYFLSATVAWMGFVLLMALGVMNLQICAAMTGWMKNLSAGVIAVMAISVAGILFWIITAAAVPTSWKNQCRTAFLTAAGKPLPALFILAIHVGFILLIVLDEVNRPTYGFIGTFFGFALMAYVSGKMLYSTLEEYRKTM